MLRNIIIEYKWKVYQVSSLYSKIDILPSEDAQASIKPYSCGAHEIEFTEDSWKLCEYNFFQLD